MARAGSSLIGAHHPDVGREFGSYRVLSVLGEGGMGVVYMAEHVLLGRKVAVKRLKDKLTAKPDAVQRFFEEARTVNRIKHPHIVEITDFVNEDGQAYYVMELLEGQTVAKALRIEGVLSARRALNICHQVAEALEASHADGIVHADIKPSNIYLTEKGGQPDFVKLLDFGVAQLIGSTGTDPSAAPPPAASLGTPVYMSPEQARGDPMDHRSDLYSLGAVLYEMLSGRPPFVAESTPEYLYKHMNIKPMTLTRLKDVPQPIPSAPSRVVMRCLEKDPEHRYASATELKQHVQKAAKATGIILREGSAPSIQVPRIRLRRSLPWIAMGVVLAAAVAVGVIFGLRAGEKTGRKSEAANPPAAPRKKPRPAPTHVLLSVDTAPRGAEVIRTDNGNQLLGLTPLRLRLPAVTGNVKWTLTMQREGFKPKTVRVSLATDQTVSLELKPIEPQAPEPRTRPEDDPGARGKRRARKKTRRRRGKTEDPTEKPKKPRKRGPHHIVDPFDGSGRK